MKILVLFLGCVLCGFLLFQFNSGEIITNDIVSLVIHDDQSQEVVLNFEDFEPSEPEDNSDHIYASIITPNLDQSHLTKEFLKNLKKNQDIETFIIIGENHSLLGKYNINGCDQTYETDDGDLETNVALLKKLSIGCTQRAFEDNPPISNLVPYIKNEFPDAKIVPITIKHFTKNEDLDIFAENLSNAADSGAFVLVSTEFTQQLTDQTALFHNELTRNIFETFDKTGISQMDTDSRPSIYLLLSYLENVNAQQADILNETVSNGGSHFFVNFYKGEPKGDRNLTIMAFGDMMLGRYVRTLMDEHGENYIFENIKGHEKRFFEGADYIFGNLEGPIKGEGRSGGTSMVFGFNEDVAPLLKRYGFNLFSLANNHATDQRWEGRDTTIAALDNQGIGWCGHPSEADSGSVYYDKISDKDIAVLCFHDVTYKLDDAAALDLISTVRPNVDYLIVSVHWGYEYQHSPDWGTEIEPGHAFVDAGADFVIGHHPHVVQSFEVYNGKLIFYSLGNFIFDQYWSQMTQEELAIGISLNDMEDGVATKVFLFPMKSELSQSRLMTDEEYDWWIEEFIGYGEYSEEMKEMIRNGVIEVAP